MGLLNFLPEDDAKKAAMRQGLLQFGAEMLAGRGNFGTTLGQGLGAGVNGYQGSLASQQQAQLNAMQADRWKLENEASRRAAGEPDAIAKIVSGAAAQPLPQVPTAAQSLTGVATPPGAAPLPSAVPPGSPDAPDAKPVPSNAIAPISALPTVNAAAPVPNVQPAKPRQYTAEDYRAIGDRLAETGRMAAAKPYYEQAEKMKPKLKEVKTMTTPDGKRVMVNVNEDGTYKTVDGYAPDAEKLSFHNTGASTVGLDPYTGKPVQTIANTQSPDSVARVDADMRVQREITKRAGMGGGGGSDARLDPETVAQMAQQYRAGDTSVMTGLGRGTQGPANIVAVRKEITRQNKEEGKGGADLAASNAAYFGTKAGQRTAGTRIANVEMAANEAESLIPLAQQASASVARSGFLPFGKAQIMFDAQTNNPEMRQFAAANNALVNVYARAISPSGTPTVADKEHAREMIATAMDHKSYMAVTEQMQKEITAARSAPKAVRKAFNDEVTGKDGHSATPAVKAAPYSDADKERRYQEWKRSQAK